LCGRSISTAHVADRLARFESAFYGHLVRELQDGFVTRFVAIDPETVMDVFAPDPAVKPIELVVVLGDVLGRDLAAGKDEVVCGSWWRSRGFDFDGHGHSFEWTQSRL
jgi:hypothetical protein